MTIRHARSASTLRYRMMIEASRSPWKILLMNSPTWMLKMVGAFAAISSRMSAAISRRASTRSLASIHCSATFTSSSTMSAVKAPPTRTRKPSAAAAARSVAKSLEPELLTICRSSTASRCTFVASSPIFTGTMAVTASDTVYLLAGSGLLMRYSSRAISSSKNRFADSPFSSSILPMANSRSVTTSGYSLYLQREDDAPLADADIVGSCVPLRARTSSDEKRSPEKRALPSPPARACASSGCWEPFPFAWAAAPAGAREAAAVAGPACRWPPACAAVGTPAPRAVAPSAPDCTSSFTSQSRITVSVVILIVSPSCVSRR